MKPARKPFKIDTFTLFQMAFIMGLTEALTMCLSVHMFMVNCFWKIEFETQSKDWILSNAKLYNSMAA